MAQLASARLCGELDQQPPRAVRAGRRRGTRRSLGARKAAVLSKVEEEEDSQQVDAARGGLSCVPSKLIPPRHEG
jgi:hypothetical protein